MTMRIMPFAQKITFKSTPLAIDKENIVYPEQISNLLYDNGKSRDRAAHPSCYMDLITGKSFKINKIDIKKLITTIDAAKKNDNPGKLYDIKTCELIDIEKIDEIPEENIGRMKVY